MSVYTTVSRDELAPWLRQFTVGELLDLQGISAGIENTNYFVDTQHGRYVLTLFEKLTASELPYYIDLMAHLAEHGIPCPGPVASLDGKRLLQLNGKPACLATRLNGKSVLETTVNHCAQIGEMLASIHLAGKSYPASMDNPRGPKWWKETAPDVLSHMDDADALMLKEELRYQALFRFQDLPRGVIHADLFRDNALFDGDRLAGIIDFYFACNDAWLYDVAITVNDWCTDSNGVLDRERMLALLRAYHSVRPFTPIERGAWPVMLRAGALRFWMSRLYDLHFPRPGEQTHAKDPGHFQRILAGHIAAESELKRIWV